jgi:hypothetical protein
MKIAEYFNDTQTTVERDATLDEVKQREADIEKDKADLVAKEAEAEAKATAKAELLARLGITAEEAQLLLS